MLQMVGVLFFALIIPLPAPYVDRARPRRERDDRGDGCQIIGFGFVLGLRR